MIERPQWCRPSATAHAGVALLSASADWARWLQLASRERPEGSTDPLDGFKLSLVSDLRKNPFSNFLLVSYS